MLLSPPVGDTELRDSILGEQGIAEQKLHTLNVVVQSFWERRLKGISPHDHISGKEVSRTDPPIPPIAYSQPRPDHSSQLLMSSSNTGVQSQQPQTVLPSLLGSQSTLRNVTTHHNSSGNTTGANKYTTLITKQPGATNALTGTRLLQIHQQQQKQQQQQVKSSSLSTALHSSSNDSLPLTVTDTDVRLQEQRVMLLRQQLMAAQSSL